MNRKKGTTSGPMGSVGFRVFFRLCPEVRFGV